MHGKDDSRIEVVGSLVQRRQVRKLAANHHPRSGSRDHESEAHHLRRLRLGTLD